VREKKKKTNRKSSKKYTCTKQAFWKKIWKNIFLFSLFFFKWCYSLAAAGNKSVTRPPLPPPGCTGEWKETGRNRWVGIRAV